MMIQWHGMVWQEGRKGFHSQCIKKILLKSKFMLY